MVIYNKHDLAKRVAEALNISKKEALTIVEAIFDSMKEAIAEGKNLEIYQFGKWEITERAGRSGINPKTMEKIEIADSKALKFKASKSLKDQIR